MSSPHGLPENILILGDESKSARAMERLLKGAGHNARAMGSFGLAREALRSTVCSLLIIELSAPRISGSFIQVAEDDSGQSLRRLNWAQDALSFCRDIRTRTSSAELPIILISKSQRAQDKVACLNAGVTDYIGKPYQRNELLSRVKAHLRFWQYERERNERFEQQTLMHAVSSVLATSLEPETLAQGTLSILVRRLRALAGLVFVRMEEDQPLTILASEGFDSRAMGDGQGTELCSAITTQFDSNPQMLDGVPDSLASHLPMEVRRSAGGLFFASLMLNGKATGYICLFSRTHQPFQKQSVELLSTVCNQFSIALENARLYVETKKSAAQLSFVYNLGNNLMTSLEMEELLGYAVFTVGKSLECDACAVIVRASESNQLASAIFSRSQEEKPRASDWFDDARAIAYMSAADHNLQQTVETREVDRFLRDPNITMETIVPLMFDDALLGVLICGSYQPKQFSHDDQKLLGLVAQQLSLAIRNTELYRRTKDTSINLAVEVARRTREIEEQKRFTEKIIDSLPVSLYVVDRDMRIVAWNRNREVGGQGISRDEVLGKSVFHVLARQPRRMLEDEFLDVCRTGEMKRMEQESWIAGQRKVWAISKIPMRVDNAEVTHVITVGEDITDQKKMNEAVIHAEKLASIGRLAAGVVHELNNPLATIAACAEALTVRVDEISEQETSKDFSEYLQIVRDEAFRCKTITNSLLDFSHQRQAEKTSADINQIIDQTLQLIKHHPKLGRMKVIRELDPNLTPVYVNEGQMKQIFIALISNANDAMDANGQLTIRTRWQDSGQERRVCVEYTDTGCGIPTSHLQKIFDPFFTTKPLGRGTGLGLSVCYGIVSEHGGSIEVDSTEGVGSTFRVLLPVSPEFRKKARPQREHILEMEGAL